MPISIPEVADAARQLPLALRAWRAIGGAVADGRRRLDSI
jgi:hypothetical protein